MFKIIGADGKQYGPVSADQIRQWLARRSRQVRDARASGRQRRLETARSNPGVSPRWPRQDCGSTSIASCGRFINRGRCLHLFSCPQFSARFFCCIPFGIVAIVFAAQVSSKLHAGDILGAQRASATARTWFWAAFLTGFVFSALWLLLCFASRDEVSPMVTIAQSFSARECFSQPSQRWWYLPFDPARGQSLSARAAPSLHRLVVVPVAGHARAASIASWQRGGCVSF